MNTVDDNVVSTAAAAFIDSYRSNSCQCALLIFDVTSGTKVRRASIPITCKELDAALHSSDAFTLLSAEK